MAIGRLAKLISLCLITFGGHSAHLACCVHKSDRAHETSKYPENINLTHETNDSERNHMFEKL